MGSRNTLRLAAERHERWTEIVTAWVAARDEKVGRAARPDRAGRFRRDVVRPDERPHPSFAVELIRAVP
jgi:hypothetical protein